MGNKRYGDSKWKYTPPSEMITLFGSVYSVFLFFTFVVEKFSSINLLLLLLLRFGFLSYGTGITLRLSPRGPQVGGKCAITCRFTRFNRGTVSAALPEIFPGTNRGLAHWSKLGLQKRSHSRSGLTGSGAGRGNAGNKY
jgi:hypothetical protein